MNNPSEILKEIKTEQAAQAEKVAKLGDTSIDALLYAIKEGYHVSFKEGAALIKALHQAVNADNEGVYFDWGKLEDVGVEMSMAVARHKQETGSEPYGMADFHRDGLGIL